MNLLTGGIINLLIYQIAIVTTVVMLQLIDKNITTHTPRQRKNNNDCRLVESKHIYSLILMSEVPAYLDLLTTSFCFCQDSRKRNLAILLSVVSSTMTASAFRFSLLYKVLFYIKIFVIKDFRKIGSDALLQNGLRFYQNSDIQVLTKVEVMQSSITVLFNRPVAS